MPREPRATPADFARIYAAFESSISRYDCGKKCSPLNGGSPVCCSTEHAVPIVSRAEWNLLRQRTDLWFAYKPADAAGRAIVDELDSGCAAIECKGARFCERENRTIACRAFPFFPYITAAGEFVGLAYFWGFEDRCWVISNLGIVERRFVDECCDAFEALFAVDRSEYEAVKDESAAMRRVFSRWNRPIPILARGGGYLKAMPRGGRIRPAKVDEFKKHGPYRSARAWNEAVADAEAQAARARKRAETAPARRSKPRP